MQTDEENLNWLLIITLCFSLFCGIFVGQHIKQQEIENRAKNINKKYITNQELEVIIFGEKQE